MKIILATMGAVFLLMLATPVDAASCVRIIRQGNSEVLYNKCNACRVVSLMRQRAGNALPVRREFTLSARSKFPVPFRGPGRTRITNDMGCKGEANAQKLQQSKPARTGKQCVQLTQGPSGSVVLANSCKSCRGVAIKRMNISGRSLGQQVYKLLPQAVVSVKSKGAARVALLAEVACPN